MKPPFLPGSIVCIIFVLILVIIPVTANPTISGISPASANRGDTVTMTITGSGFDLPATNSYKYVRLYLNDNTVNITASSITSSGSANIIAKFSIGSSKTKGVWSVVVVNDDGSEYVYPDAFIITDEMSLTSITPAYAKTNNDTVPFKISGSGLSDVQKVYFFKSGYANVSATAIDPGSTSVTGTFDLTGISEETYKICVMDSQAVQKCSSSVTFDVITDKVGEVDISSSPTGVNIYLDSVYMGVTPLALKDVTPGSHIVKLTKDGYLDWSKIVKVSAGTTTTLDVDLSSVTTTMETPEQTTTRPTTVKTIPKATTIKVPTPYPKTTATTPASPVEGAVIIGAIGLGIIALHRKY
ncbi:MAG TPA: PEGA domain-containing protein [Methanoregula sp.]|nr:PEGA domain-containing protein [Methanoregula sp.]